MALWIPGVAAAVLSALLVAPAFAQRDDVSQLIAMYVRNGVAELGLDATTPEGREKIARLEQAVREELTERTLILREARRRNLPIEEQFDARRRTWIARLGGEIGYRAYLAEHGLGDAELRRVIEQEIAGELLGADLTREIRVGEEEISRFYAAGRSDPALASLFVAPETVTACHILIAARTGLHTDMAERRARAERIRRALLDGADFALSRASTQTMRGRGSAAAISARSRETRMPAASTRPRSRLRRGRRARSSRPSTASTSSVSRRGFRSGYGRSTSSARLFGRA